MPEEQQRQVLCDAHVHVYDCFDVGTLLDSAITNIQSAAHAGKVRAFDGVLLLSETSNDHWFDRLATGGAPAATAWSLSETAEESALIARRDDGATIFIIAGRQVITAENLEILHLATRLRVEDGLPADEVIARGKDNGCIVVAPWGFGKWWGRRGELLDRLIASNAPGDLLLGDNSGRPWFLPSPRQFSLAEQEGRLVLPGTDPLPFAGEERRVGSVGFVIDHLLDHDAPASDLRRCLNGDHADVEPYMQTEGLIRFARNQVGMQLRKKPS